MVSGNLWSCLKEVKPLIVFDGERKMALEPMQGNQTSSPINLGYNKLFHIVALTSGSL